MTISKNRKVFKIELSKRSDQTGFCIRHGGRKVLSLYWWKLWRYQKRSLVGWVLHFNPLPSGAGYVWGQRRFSGYTAYLGWRARGGKGPPNGPWPTLRAGLTDCANHVPYSFG
jgi:hypothetical protein